MAHRLIRNSAPQHKRVLRIEVALAARKRNAAAKDIAGFHSIAGPAVEFVDAGQRVDFIQGDPGLVRIAFALPGAVPESLAIGDTTLEILETSP